MLCRRKRGYPHSRHTKGELWRTRKPKRKSTKKQPRKSSFSTLKT